MISAILTAAFAQATTGAGWVTTSTKLLHWADVPASQRPALFQTMGNPELDTAGDGAAGLILPLNSYIYVTHTVPAGPAAQLADRIDALRTAFAPPIGSQWQTLGGLVHRATITGTIQTDEGTLGTDAVAIVPVRITVG